MNTQIIRPPTPIKTGIMMLWPTNTAPPGWLLCFGQAVSRTGYAGLFAAIGTTFGVGDGSTTFNLPDYRGRLPLGKDNMGGSSANRVTSAQADSIGGASGAENHTLTAAQTPAHTHTLVKSTGVTDGDTGIKFESAYVCENFNTSSVGSGDAHNNMPPYLTVNYIIKI